jgi:APA family basic amino acid/polyamine antiporter
VFTTLGLQAIDIQSGFALIFAWVLGGLIALCGVLSYRELVAAMPKSGREYHFSSRIYRPQFGLMAGWVSVTIGFSAPVALAAMALSRYAATFTNILTMITAVLTILIVTVIHASNVRTGQIFQIVTTILKLIVIVGFCTMGILAHPVEALSWVPTKAALSRWVRARLRSTTTPEQG